MVGTESLAASWPGKKRDHPPVFHPALWHMLDVAACGLALLRRHPVLGALPESETEALAYLIAAHDIGKFSDSFRALLIDGKPQTFKHWELSDRLLLDLDPRIARSLGGEAHVRRILYAAVAGHHGGPPTREQTDIVRKRAATGSEATAAASCFIDLLGGLFPRADLSLLDEDRAVVLSWLLSGLTVAADWIGSSESWFGFEDPAIPLECYWRQAQSRAEAAVRNAGLLTVPARRGLDPARLTGVGALRPMQSAATWAALPEEGPVLALIEDSTGAGKTEAAMILSHRLLSADRARGVFFALPTMATSNAMFERLRRMVPLLFDGAPSLALAHGRSRYHEGFQRLIGPVRAEPDDASCAPWLADDRRRTLMAQIGVGTIDQALMAVLPTRFCTLRLFGLSDHVLIVDEAHSYDPYMERQLCALLQFHAMLGGSVILMTATLPFGKRARLVAAFQKGLGVDRPPAVTSTAYPALSLVGQGVMSLPVAPVPATCRRLAIRRLDADGDAVNVLCDAAARGAACVWIRNAVDDAIAAVGALRRAGITAGLLHARFAMADRLAIEAEVMARFGPAGTDRAGRVLVATQVVEASLDLDFDVMISDLAPIGSLLQRAGRLWRHMDRRPADRRPVEGPLLHVLGPDPAQVADARWIHSALDRGAWVYPQDELWRTAKALSERPSIAIPEDLRDTIEAVHGDEAPPVPTPLQHSEDRSLGKMAAERALAQRNVLDPSEPYLQPQTARVFDDERYPTRLGIPQKTLVLASRRDGALHPWARADDLTVFVKQVVRRFHAASLISGALISVSGLSQTGPAGCQLRVLPDQRSGFCARAFAERLARWARAA